MPPPPIEPDTKIKRCNRKIRNEGRDCIIGCANIRGHDFLKYGNQGVGFQDPNGKDGDLPEAEEDVSVARSCLNCLRTGTPLQYGIGKEKPGNGATDEEIYDCLKNAPLKGNYGGLLNNCNSWASSAAERCGIDFRNSY